MSEHLTGSGSPRCWAYSPQGLRCEGDAGHQDRHIARVLWSDDEAVAPGHLIAAELDQALHKVTPPEGIVVARPPAEPKPKPKGEPGQIMRQAPPEGCPRCGHELVSHLGPPKVFGECLVAGCVPCSGTDRSMETLEPSDV